MFSSEDFTKFGKIGVDGPLADGEFSDLDFDEIAKMTPGQYDTFYGSLTDTQKGMIDGLQDNNQIFINNNKKGTSLGQELIGALSGLKDTAGQIANIKNKTSSLNNNLATDENIEAAQNNPLNFLKMLGIDFSSFLNPDGK